MPSLRGHTCIQVFSCYSWDPTNRLTVTGMVANMLIVFIGVTPDIQMQDLLLPVSLHHFLKDKVKA